MFRNYLKIALRTLRSQKLYALVNVFGLAIGMAACLLILLYVRDERSYDRFHAKVDRVYRLAYDAETGGRLTQWAYSGAQWGRQLAAAFPEVEATARLAGNLGDQTTTVRYGDRMFAEGDVYWADAAVFDVFALPLVRGDTATALAAPGTVVLSATAARKYFGDDDPLGKTLRVDDTDLQVTGVFADLPSNTHLRFDFLASLATVEAEYPDFDTIWLYTYVLLREGASAEAVRAKMPAFIEQNIERTGFLVGLKAVVLQPLADLHLQSHRQGEPGPGGDVATLYILSVVALLILAIACINFMNLATARATRRAREVGLRKVLGAYRRQLVAQFLGEAVLLCLIGVVLAVGLTLVLLPPFNALAGKALSAAVLLEPALVLGLVAVVFLVGVLAGSYPALFLSAFEPATVLKGHTRGAGRRAWLRQGLVVGQFVVSIALLIGTGLVMEQLRFVRHKQLGFTRAPLVTVPLDGTPLTQAENLEALRAQLLRDPRVENATGSSNRMGERIWIWNYRPEGWQGEEEYWTVSGMLVDNAYLDTYGLEVVAGRPFSLDHPGDDEHAILINEAAARFLGWDDPVGRTMTTPGPEGEPQEVTVVGVVADFHYASLHQEVAPLILNLGGFSRYLTIRLAPGDAAGTRAFLEETWRAFVPGQPPQFSFVDGQMAQLYEADRRLSRVVGAFTGFAVLVACLGLFGLASFTTEQRRKEIGVRKVMGATVPGIVALLSKDFTRLVLLGFAVAAPLSYAAADRWLDTFAYRIVLFEHAWVFAAAGLAALAVALLTVSYQSIRAATTDPVESLRYE